MLSLPEKFPLFLRRRLRKEDSAERMLSFFHSRLVDGFRSFPLPEERSEESIAFVEKTRRVRTLFVSDLHLGSRTCRADLVLSFLKKYEAETLYLVGDIIDGWRLRKSWYWPRLHEEVLQTLLAKAAAGSRVVYIPGNHDDFLRPHCGRKATRIEVAETAIHTTANGKRFLVMHGDQLDEVVRNIPWLAHIGDIAYDLAIVLNSIYNGIAGFFGLEYRSIAAWAKFSVKRVVSFIGKFEEALVSTGRNLNVDGVVCGHIHYAAIRNLQEICYINTGDWVENCTAVVENLSGEMELVRYSGKVFQPEPQELPRLVGRMA